MEARVKKFYEGYWSRKTPPPLTDPTTKERKARLKKVLSGLGSGVKVLDLGCGNGEFSAFTAELGFEVVGVDISETAIKTAKEKYKQISFLVLNQEGRIPAEDGIFDTVWSSEVLEHIFDVHSFLSEVNRVLKPEGLLVLTTPYHGRIKNILISLIKFDEHFNPEGEHIRFFDKAGLERCLKKAGFQPISWGGIGRLPLLYRTWFVVSKKTN